MNTFRNFIKGFFAENPLFVIVLGTCPSLAVTTSLENGIGMGVATTFVLLCSNVIIAAIRKIVPDQIRIPCYIVVIAAFVTIVDLAMRAYFPALSRSLGIFIPLIVVNCIVLGRAEAYAAKNGIAASFIDGLGMGLGYFMALLLLSGIRELLGNGTLLGRAVFPADYPAALIMILPPGAFITLGFLIALFNRFILRKKS